MIKRRAFITLLGGAAAAWPLAARAQAAGKTWRIGFVVVGSRPNFLESSFFGGFAQGMRELGYSEGKDFIIEWRFADGDPGRIPKFAAELAELKIDLFVTGVSALIPRIREGNASIPIIMAYSIDPVGQGLVASLARPGGNITGLSSAISDIMPKQLDLLLTAVPNLSRVAVLAHPDNLTSAIAFKSLDAAARQARLTLRPVEACNAQEIDNAFDVIARERVGALIVLVDAIFVNQRRRIAELANRNRLPSMFGNRDYVEAGGLMSYGDSLREFFRRAAGYADKIIKGAKPGDLPIELPTKFHLIVNRKTADALGLTIPPLLYMFAEEVIE